MPSQNQSLPIVGPEAWLMQMGGMSRKGISGVRRCDCTYWVIAALAYWAYCECGCCRCFYLVLVVFK